MMQDPDSPPLFLLRRGVPMTKVYNVYRVDYRTKTKVPIGTIVERRKSPRGKENPLSLVKLARKIYGESVEDQFRIVVDDVYSA
jgi:hypothetical protein